MNTTRQNHFAAFAAAAFMTLGMLFSVNAIATSDAPPALLAQVQGQAQQQG